MQRQILETFGLNLAGDGLGALARQLVAHGVETSVFDPEALLDEAEAARLAKCSPRTLQTWRRELSGPPFVRLGGKLVRYRRRDLVAWLERSTIRPSCDLVGSVR